MEDWQNRVKEELTDLRTKLSKLREFTFSEKFSGIPSRQRDLLTEQIRIMERYSDVLKARISAF